MSNERRSQLFRRDFLVGATAGVTAGAAAWFGAPATWHEAQLPFGTRLTYAQNGEDCVVLSLFQVLKIERPTYLDIGAYEPIVCSNTYLFYTTGSRGVLVEPNVDLTPKLASERPGDVVITAGIGLDDRKEADYYVTSLPQLNTFDKDAADRIEKIGGSDVKVLRVVKMPLRNINGVIAEHFGGAAPDFLSLDTEGLDLAILKTLDFGKYRSPIICAEHSNNTAERAVLLELLTGHGYTVRGQTFANTIFVDNKRMSFD